MRTAALALPLVLLLGLGRTAADGPDPDPEQVARGKQVFETVCVGCHTVAPPPDSAPPMAHVVRHLRMELESFEAFAEHVRTYVAAPAPDRSLLPPMAIERFGLMGALPMGDSILTDVAAYIWTLADSAPPGRGMGMHGRRGMEPATEAAEAQGPRGAGRVHRHGAQGGPGGEPGGQGRMYRHGAQGGPGGEAGASERGGGMCRMMSPEAEASGGSCRAGGCKEGGGDHRCPGDPCASETGKTSCCASAEEGETASCCADDGCSSCASHGGTEGSCCEGHRCAGDGCQREPGAASEGGPCAAAVEEPGGHHEGHHHGGGR